MKVNIGPYKSDIIPVSRWQRFYERKRSGKYYLDEEDYTWYDKIVMGAFDKFEDLVRPINRWSNSRKRKVEVHIDNYDVWSADHTLALVIHPVLVKLKEQKQGSPHVDPEDVPEELRPSVEPNNENGYVDDSHHERWAWVLDEMIWAFEQAKSGDYNEYIFHHNSDQLEMKFEEVEGSKLKEIKFNYQKDSSKPAYYVDRDGKEAHFKRIQNGMRLFSKYYMGLWD